MSDLYVKCPRCKGSKLIYATTVVGNDYFPSRGEWFNCPVCYATGDADIESAEEFEDSLKGYDDEN